MSWIEAHQWESDWWGDCTNTYGEEEKQLLYADRMGLELFHNRKSPYNIDLGGRSVVDIGGGPTSLLLKCANKGMAVVVDPLPFPRWVELRYAMADIFHLRFRGEDFCSCGFDEAWIYNCLQHVADPELIVDNARTTAEIVRVFEWIDTPTNVGHPTSLSEGDLDRWLGGKGKVEEIEGAANCYGRAYYGIFPSS